MSYCHTQRGKLHHLGNVGAVLLIWASISAQTSVVELVVILVLAMMLIFMALSFAEMTVRDEGEHLAIRYGPVPLIWKRVAYADMAGVEESKSSWIDGLGIHFLPWRGWTFNLWGFACAEIHLRGRRRPVRVGSDDTLALVQFLRQRIASEAPQKTNGSPTRGPLSTSAP